MRISLGRSAVLTTTTALAAATGFVASPAAARTEVSPYIELQQVVDAELGGDGDVLTYSSIAVGIDASASTRRTQAQASYRYERRIEWGDDDTSDSLHTGLARLNYALTPDITLEAGGIAARARGDNRVATPIFLTGGDDDDNNTSQIYGAYAGPSFAKTVGHLDLTANYRFGYVNVDGGNGALDLGPGQPVLDDYSSSTSHTIDASVGMRVGVLPFAWTVSGGYIRENVNRLDGHYDEKYVRGDITVPLTRTFAVTAGVGYENIKASQSEILRNPDGSPVLNSRRRFIADPSAPRVTSFETDGLIYDGGFIWRPNRRTTLEAHAGKRYGDTFVTATLDYRISETLGFQAAVYNEVQSFGRQLTGRVAALPTSFQNPINPLVGNLDGCVFGQTPGTGGCLGGQSITTSNFRSRGVYAQLSGGRGLWSYGVGAGYDQRKYLAPGVTGAGVFTLDGVKDDSFTAEAWAERELSANSSIEGRIYGLWYDSGIGGNSAVTDLGAIVTYDRAFTNRLTGQAAVGIYTTEQSGSDSSTVGSALVGVRYQF